MKNIFEKIVSLLKTIFGSGIETKVDNHSKYNINKNKQCNISINEGEKKDERKYCLNISRKK